MSEMFQWAAPRTPHLDATSFILPTVIGLSPVAKNISNCSSRLRLSKWARRFASLSSSRKDAKSLSELHETAHDVVICLTSAATAVSPGPVSIKFGLVPLILLPTD